jgi:hypothetical protein
MQETFQEAIIITTESSKLYFFTQGFFFLIYRILINMAIAKSFPRLWPVIAVEPAPQDGLTT